LPPREIELRRLPDEELKKLGPLTERCIGTVRKRNLPAWPKERLDSLDALLRDLLQETAVPYTAKPYHGERFDQWLERDPIVSTLIYWNDIDQYIHMFRGCIRWQIADRLQAFLANQDDFRTGFGISRQLMELTCHAIACQFMITLFHQHLVARQSDIEKVPIVFSGSFENFVLAITCWDKKQGKRLGKRVNKKLFDGPEYHKAICNPTTDKLIGVTKFVAGNFDEKKRNHGRSLVEAVTKLEESYRYMCAFVHPTAMSFPIDKVYLAGENVPREDDIVLSCLLTFLEILENSNHLMHCMFFDQDFDRIRLAETMVRSAYRYNGDPNPPQNLDVPFIDDFMKRYKPDVVIETGYGEAVVFQRQDNKKATRRQ